MRVCLWKELDEPFFSFSFQSFPALPPPPNTASRFRALLAFLPSVRLAPLRIGIFCTIFVIRALFVWCPLRSMTTVGDIKINLRTPHRTYRLGPLGWNFFFVSCREQD